MEISQNLTFNPNQTFKLTILPNLVICLSSIATLFTLFSRAKTAQRDALVWSTILESDLTLNRERSS